MPRQIVVTTPRLTLQALDIESLKLLSENRTKFAQHLGVNIPEHWPAPDLIEALPFFIGLIEQNPSAYMWLVWITVETKAKNIVGGIGFKGSPDMQGTVEVGYDTAEMYRGLGLATEALQGITNWAFEQSQVRRVIAETDKSNFQSHRVLEKAGYLKSGENETIFFWERLKSL